jgi:ribosomal protein L11 methyltransferase
MDTIELKIDLVPREPWTGILIAELSEMGFDGFMETKTGLLAYAPDSVDVEQAVSSSSIHENSEVKCSIEKKVIPYQNWNAEWESQFEPVRIDDKATIIAPFHSDEQVQGMKVIIEPQMSFGTGHHQTTWMMARQLFELKRMPERVLDMGAGTGVLAIIAEKLGATELLAVDIEAEARRNIEHNAQLNGSKCITAICGDIEVLDDAGSFGLILANINKNVLKAHMRRYWELLEDKGELWLSGFFQSDLSELQNFAEEIGFSYLGEREKEGWALLMLNK